jgi:MoaA/NifB/PqqE/SkfB family radical SAM enzyme
VRPYAAEKARNRRLLDEDLAARRDTFRAMPTQLVLEPTNRCNAACPICARHFWDDEKNPPADMLPETLARLDDLLTTAETVFAFGHGEPTIAPLFWNIVVRAKEKGCRVEITTNGLTLDELFIDRLVAAKVDILNLSLDAVEPTALTHRRGLSVERAQQALSYLAQRKHEQRTTTPEAGLAVVLDRDNLDELPGLFRFAGDLGAKSVLLNHLVAWDASLHARSAYHEPDRLRDALARATRDAAAAGVNVVLPFDAVENGVCPHPLHMFFVRASGEVWPCCNAAFDNGAYSFAVGHVLKEAPEAIWNGPAYRRLRRAFLTGESLPDHCRICPLYTDELGSHLRKLR